MAQWGETLAAQRPECDPWNPHKGGREDLLYGCPSTSTCAVSHIPVTQIAYMCRVTCPLSQKSHTLVKKNKDFFFCCF